MARSLTEDSSPQILFTLISTSVILNILLIYRIYIKIIIIIIIKKLKMELRVGSRYRLGRKIGSGSFGDIYLGKTNVFSSTFRY